MKEVLAQVQSRSAVRSLVGIELQYIGIFRSSDSRNFYLEHFENSPFFNIFAICTAGNNRTL